MSRPSRIAPRLDDNELADAALEACAVLRARLQRGYQHAYGRHAVTDLDTAAASIAEHRPVPAPMDANDLVDHVNDILFTGQRFGLSVNHATAMLWLADNAHASAWERAHGHLTADSVAHLDDLDPLNISNLNTVSPLGGDDGGRARLRVTVIAVAGGMLSGCTITACAQMDPDAFAWKQHDGASTITVRDHRAPSSLDAAGALIYRSLRADGVSIDVAHAAAADTAIARAGRERRLRRDRG